MHCRPFSMGRAQPNESSTLRSHGTGIGMLPRDLDAVQDESMSRPNDEPHAHVGWSHPSSATRMPTSHPNERASSASEPMRSRPDHVKETVPRRASTISKSSVVRCLKSTKQRSVCSFVAKRCSISLSSVASRLSLGHGHAVPTALSDYARYYHTPGQHGTGLGSMNFQDEEPNDAMFYTEGDAKSLSAVELLQNARSNESHDIVIEDQLKRKRNGMDFQQWHRYVTGYDCRGVTALHLAVAYGYRATCGVLIDGGADCQAETQQGETPRAFAKAAQKLAGHQHPLYYRIMTCREFVQHNRVPPVPREKQSGEPAYTPPKRSETSQTAQLPSHLASSPGQSMSLRRKAINRSRMANDQTLHSFSAEDLSSANIPLKGFDQDGTSSASTTSLVNESSDQTQQSFFGSNFAYSESPVASLSAFDRFGGVSTRDFAASRIPLQDHRPNLPSAYHDATVSPLYNTPLGSNQQAPEFLPELQPQAISAIGSQDLASSNVGMYGESSYTNPPMNELDDLDASWRIPHAASHPQGGSTIRDVGVYGNSVPNLPGQDSSDQVAVGPQQAMQSSFQPDPTMMAPNSFDGPLDFSDPSDTADTMMDIEQLGQDSHTSSSLYLHQQPQSSSQMQSFIPAPLPPVSNAPLAGPWNPWYTCSHGEPTCAR